MTGDSLLYVLAGSAALCWIGWRVRRGIKRRIREYGAGQHKRGYFAGISAAEEYLKRDRMTPSKITNRFNAISDSIAADTLIIDAGCSVPSRNSGGQS